MSVRVRYAPSPTGLQHIGGVRTALFNYFFARASGGKFILRIEDTDRERYDPRALQDIYDTFDWLGIQWDEGPRAGGNYGPYFQSERTDLYREYAQKLVASGQAYYCFCSAGRLEQMREQQALEGAGQGYDRHCRNIPPVEALARKEKGEPCVIRLRIPLEGSTGFHDRLIGTIERANKDINPDPVLLKSDGFPTYHLANVIDDHFMEITHIMRAQEWIPSGPLHVLLYQAFGWETPEYCHLPMVMGDDGQKLSKRHGSTSLIEFRGGGYLPEAIINYVSLLGWSYDDSRQMFSRSDLEQLFTLDKLNKAAAVFDYKKLEWFNGIYIRECSEADLARRLLPFLWEENLLGNPPSAREEKTLLDSIPIIRERLHSLADAAGLLRFIFGDAPDYAAEDLLPKKTSAAEALRFLEEIKNLMPGFFDKTDEGNEADFRALSEKLGTRLGNILAPLRVAVTGSKVSPPLFESIRLVGKEKTLARIEKAAGILSKAAG
ncbi:MAG: glutamate--tRNA ligase [Spirochaetales bacterium]|jgi:glutamyl-tRNA synthetase|nr:glutamate--tRNA ligase [Spirochaetales bacterium]